MFNMGEAFIETTPDSSKKSKSKRSNGSSKHDKTSSKHTKHSFKHDKKQSKKRIAQSEESPVVTVPNKKKKSLEVEDVYSTDSSADIPSFMEESIKRNILYSPPEGLEWAAEEEQNKQEGNKKEPTLKGIDKLEKPGKCVKISLTNQGKPNWKDVKQQAAVLKKQRKERELTNYEVVQQSKKLWEKVRREECPSEQKAELLASLHDLTKDHISKMVFAHDTSRIIQCLLKLGSPTIRASICESLIPIIIEVLQNKFSSHCIKSLFKYGDKDCISKVINALRGHVIKLVTNAISGPLVEDAYSVHATPEQKKFMEEEFYGKSWRICVGLEVKSLRDGIVTSVDTKKAVLDETKENIIRVINKNFTHSSLLHYVTSQFLDVCCPEDREEILSLLSPHIMDLVKTKHGSHISMQCCWYGTKKVKKAIIKQLKNKVVEVSMMEEGYWLLLALLDSVDDTVILNKVIVAEILNDVTNVIKNVHGKKIILYLVCHRDTSYFHPHDIALLQQGDSSGTTLKSLEAKRSEIMPHVMKTLLESIIINTSEWMITASVAMVTLAVLKTASGELHQKALDAVAIFVCSDVKIEGDAIFEHPGLHLVIRKLLKLDQTQESAKESFSYYLSKTVDELTIKKWIACNRGCFLLVGIMESKKEESVAILKKKLTQNLQEAIRMGKSTGSKILHNILTASN